MLDDLEKRGFRNSRLGHHVPGLDFHVMISLEVLHGITFDYMVHAGQVVCIVEAMKLMNEIKSDVAGKIVDILVENAQPVEYGQTLFLIQRRR